MAYFAKRKSRVGAKSRWELFEDGSQVPTFLKRLEELLSSRRPFRFQLWLSGDTDLSCHLRKIDANNLVEQYGLDGLYPSQLKRVVDSLVARFEKRAAFQLPELFLIVDCEGYTIDVNWDSLAKVGKYECRFLSGGIRNSTQQKARF